MSISNHLPEDKKGTEESAWQEFEALLRKQLGLRKGIGSTWERRGREIACVPARPPFKTKVLILLVAQSIGYRPFPAESFFGTFPQAK